MPRIISDIDAHLRDRPSPAYKLGDKLHESYADVVGKVEEIDWSISFGRWGYLLRRTQQSRYGGRIGSCVWVYEHDTCLKPATKP